MKRTIAVLAILLPCSVLASPDNGYVDFGIGGVIDHRDKGFDATIEDGDAIDLAVGFNKVVRERFNHGGKITLDYLTNAEVSDCNPRELPVCGSDDFDITSLALNYDLDWRFVKPVSLLFSAGAGWGWSDIFYPDDGVFMIRSSLGLGFHANKRLQITLSVVENAFPAVADDLKYAQRRGMLGLRWDFR